MRVVINLADEFEEVCAGYSAVDQQGKDLVSLIKMFGNEYGYFDENTSETELFLAWKVFLGQHKHQMIVSPMTGLLLYNLVTYWHLGQKLYEALPILEKMLIRDTVQEISEEIDRRSAENGNAVIPG